MILYEKKFQLNSGVSFSHYIKSLDEMGFSPYILLISDIPYTTNFHIEVVITYPINLWGFHNVFSGGVLFSECTVKHSIGENFFTLQGAVGMANLFIGLFYIVLSLFIIIMTFSSTSASGTFSPGAFIFFTILSFLPLLPVLSTYRREKRLLDRIGTVASEL
jgi:hypothetical protein